MDPSKGKKGGVRGKEGGKRGVRGRKGEDRGKEGGGREEEGLSLESHNMLGMYTTTELHGLPLGLKGLS